MVKKSGTLVSWYLFSENWYTLAVLSDDPVINCVLVHDKVLTAALWPERVYDKVHSIKI